MHHYAVSIQKNEFAKPEVEFPEVVLKLLLKDEALEIDSRITGTILFQSTQSFTYWFDALSALKSEFHYHLMEIKNPPHQQPSSWHSKGIRDEFIEILNKIKSGK